MQLDKWTLIQFHTLLSDTYWIISSLPDFLTLSRLLSGNFAMLSHSLKTTLWGHFISTLKRKEKQKCWDLDNRSHEKSFWSWFVFLLDISFQRKCLCFNLPSILIAMGFNKIHKPISSAAQKEINSQSYVAQQIGSKIFSSVFSLNLTIPTRFFKILSWTSLPWYIWLSRYLYFDFWRSYT